MILPLLWACSENEDPIIQSTEELPCRDIDQDDLCDSVDEDDDGDSVNDSEDSFPTDPRRCADSDNDGCDDCAVLALPDPQQDGEDFDQDGICDFGDPDIDNDGVVNEMDLFNNDPQRCFDEDEDGCDDCTFGAPDTDNDGDDIDGDGLCNIGDLDIDGDGIPNEEDGLPEDASGCGDIDRDSCDDCSSGTQDTANDGDDLDADGRCDAGDLDIDGDGVANDEDSNAINATECSDEDEDGCDDCAGSSFDMANDGDDLDQDGMCDLSDEDIDGDGVANDLDSDANDPLVCGDEDSDLCDDCALGQVDVNADGDDLDQDGICDLSDQDADGDGVNLDIDCDDMNAAISPNSLEVCDEIDNDCDDRVDEFLRPAGEGYTLSGSGELYWEFDREVSWYYGDHGFENLTRGTIFYSTTGMHWLHFDAENRLVGIDSDLDLDESIDYSWSVSYDNLGRWIQVDHSMYQAEESSIARFEASYSEDLIERTLDIDADMIIDSQRIDILNDGKVITSFIDQDANLIDDIEITFTYDLESRLVEKSTDLDLDGRFDKKIVYEYNPLGELREYQIFNDADDEVDELITVNYDGNGKLLSYAYDTNADNSIDWVQINWHMDNTLGFGWQFDDNADDVIDSQVFYTIDQDDAVISIMTDTNADDMYESRFQGPSVCEAIEEDNSGSDENESGTE